MTDGLDAIAALDFYPWACVWCGLASCRCGSLYVGEAEAPSVSCMYVALALVALLGAWASWRGWA